MTFQLASVCFVCSGRKRLGVRQTHWEFLINRRFAVWFVFRPSGGFIARFYGAGRFGGFCHVRREVWRWNSWGWIALKSINKASETQEPPRTFKPPPPPYLTHKLTPQPPSTSVITSRTFISMSIARQTLVVNRRLTNPPAHRCPTTNAISTDQSFGALDLQLYWTWFKGFYVRGTIERVLKKILPQNIKRLDSSGRLNLTG
jgi:hypothetical protein